MKRIIASLLCMLFIFHSVIVTDAATPTDYRDIFFVKAKKPLAQFKLDVYRGSNLIESKESLVGNAIVEPPIIIAKVGDTFKISDLSDPNNAGASVSKWDFQVYGPGISNKEIYTSFNSLKSDAERVIKFDQKGTYNFFLNVMANTPLNLTDNWSNWSDNGNHRTLSANGEFYWYFTQIRVVVEEAKPVADFQILYNGEDVTDNASKPIQRSGNTLQVTLKDKSTITGGTIEERYWRFYNTNTWSPLPGQGKNDLTINVDSAQINASPNKIIFQLGAKSNTGEIDWEEHTVWSILAAAKVIVHHKDTNGNTVAVDDIINTTQGVETKVYSKAIEGYLANKTSDTVTVPNGQTQVEYTFYYSINNEAGRIIVHHKDIDGNTVAPDDVFLVALNTPTEVFSKPVANHTPNKTSDIVTVPSSDPDKLVEYTFTYTKNPPATSPITGWIECNDTVIQGNDINIKGGGNDPQGGSLTYSWEVDPSSWMVGTLTGTSSTVYFTQVGTVNVTLTVRSSSGGAATVTKAIRVLPAIPNAYIDIINPIANASNSRVNHKITLDANRSNSGSQRYTIDWSKTIWEIWVDDATPALTLNDIKTKAPFTLSTNSEGKQAIRVAGDFKQVDILSKKVGRVSLRLSITNTASNTGLTNKQFDVLPDLPPVADLTVTNKVLRDPSDSNYASGEITDLTVMQDEDRIAKRVWLYSFDSDNDGSNKLVTKNTDGSLKAIPTNEIWYVYHNASWQPVTIFGVNGSYASLKNLNIANINSGNLVNLPLRVNHVGKYRVELIVQEDLMSYTIPEFITPADIQKSYTFDE